MAKKEIWDWKGKGELVLEVQGDKYKCVKKGGVGWELGEEGYVDDYFVKSEWVVTSQESIEKQKEEIAEVDKLIEETSTQKQAMRKNEGKVELSYILEADYAIKGVCEVLSFGAEKYDRGNYKKGFPKEKLADSLLRHLTSFLNGEELDTESGLHHTDHVLANALFLAYHYNGKKYND